MANPFHPPDAVDAVYEFHDFDEDKDSDMESFMVLLETAANDPVHHGIHQHDIREVGLGMGLVKRKHCVIVWRDKNNGARR